MKDVHRILDSGKDDDISDMIIGACACGNLDLIKWVYTSLREKGVVRYPLCRLNPSSSPPLYTYEFLTACRNGQLETAKWFREFICLDVHAEDDRVFRETCGCGHLEVVKWLYGLGVVKSQNLQMAFIRACLRGRIEVIRWILSLGLVDIATVFSEWQLTLVDNIVDSWPMIGILYRAAGVRVDFDRLFYHLKVSHPNRRELMLWRGYVDPGDDCYSMEVRGRLVVMIGMELPNELEREVLEWCGWR